MPMRIPRQQAETSLRRAFEMADDDTVTLPEEWKQYVAEVWRFDAKTWVPAFGAVLLARSVNDKIDPGSIKVLKEPARDKTFSLRRLAHEVLVPLSRELGFSVRTTGREPLNNQPFFRYDHVDDIDRVGSPADLARYRELLDQVGLLDCQQALLALAAYLQVGIAESRNKLPRAEPPVSVGLTVLSDSIDKMVKIPGLGPWVTQALGATMLSIRHPGVIVRRLNDPSTDYPGDVQGVNAHGEVVVCLEARCKMVTFADSVAFSSACAAGDMHKAVLLALGEQRDESLAIAARRSWDDQGVVLNVITTAEQTFQQLITWADGSAQEILARIPGEMEKQLIAMEAPGHVTDAWTTTMIGETR